MSLLTSFKELRSTMLTTALLPLDESSLSIHSSRADRVEAILPTLRAIQVQMRSAAELLEKVLTGGGEGEGRVENGRMAAADWRKRSPDLSKRIPRSRGYIESDRVATKIGVESDIVE